MSQSDSLQQLLVEFFNLPPDTAAANLSQNGVPAWDSLAMVQLIAELQSTYKIKFELDEIEQLGNYELIRASLLQKGVSL